MRMLMKMQLPVERGNEAIKDGSLQRTMESLMGGLKPEAAYFFAEDGMRTALMVFDMQDSSEVPSAAEPAFMQLNAAVSFTPVMNADDLQKGLKAALA